MGRRAKPTSLKLVENSRDRRSQRLRMNEAQAPDGPFAQPPWFTEDQVRIWNYALASAPAGLLKPADLELFVSWVIAVDLRNYAARSLANSPALIRTSNGNVALSPYQRMFNQQTANMKALAAEFGFSPASRTGIAIEAELESDSTDRFFK